MTDDAPTRTPYLIGVDFATNLIVRKQVPATREDAEGCSTPELWLRVLHAASDETSHRLYTALPHDLRTTILDAIYDQEGNLR